MNNLVIKRSGSMNPNYGRNFTGYNSLNRKRQIINATLEELHTLHEQMIEAALERSDWNEAIDIIRYIQEK
jgi:hypothetical protein